MIVLGLLRAHATTVRRLKNIAIVGGGVSLYYGQDILNMSSNPERVNNHCPR